MILTHPRKNLETEIIYKEGISEPEIKKRLDFINNLPFEIGFIGDNEHELKLNVKLNYHSKNSVHIYPSHGKIIYNNLEKLKKQIGDYYLSFDEEGLVLQKASEDIMYYFFAKPIK